MNIISELEDIFNSIDSLKKEFLIKSKDVQSKLEEWMPDQERDSYQALYDFLTGDFAEREQGLLIEILSNNYPQDLSELLNKLNSYNDDFVMADEQGSDSSTTNPVEDLRSKNIKRVINLIWSNCDISSKSDEVFHFYKNNILNKDTLPEISELENIDGNKYKLASQTVIIKDNNIYDSTPDFIPWLRDNYIRNSGGNPDPLARKAIKTGDPNDLIGERASRSPIYLSWLKYVNELQRLIKESFTDKKNIEIWHGYQKNYFYSKVKRQQFEELVSNFLAPRISDSFSFDNQEFGFVYLIRNQDIYKIGITQNLLQRFEQLKPDQVINTIRCSNYKELERELHNILNYCRIPQTEYFRLTPAQVEEVNQLMTTKAKF